MDIFWGYACMQTKIQATPRQLCKAACRTGKSKGFELDHFVLVKLENNKLLRICKVGREPDPLKQLAGAASDELVFYFPVFKGPRGEMFPTDAEALGFITHRTFLVE